jgi:hypothetical protein
VIDELKSASNTASAMRLGEEMIAKSVCRHAVKANDPLRYPEVEKLIRDLLDCDLPYCCPHGRPTMIQISLAELEKNSDVKSDTRGAHALRRFGTWTTCGSALLASICVLTRSIFASCSFNRRLTAWSAASKFCTLHCSSRSALRLKAMLLNGSTFSSVAS